MKCTVVGVDVLLIPWQKVSHADDTCIPPGLLGGAD